MAQSNTQIDPSKVQWDSIDPGAIQWDDEKPKSRPSFNDLFRDELLTSLPGGLARGVKDVLDTGAEWLAKLRSPEASLAVKTENEAGKRAFKEAQERVGAGGSDYSRVGGQIVATAPVGGILAAPARAVGLTKLGNALSSGGFATGGAPATIAAKAGDMGLRVLGGAATGGASAALVDPSMAETGAVIGGALPPAAKVAGKTGELVGAGLRKAVTGSVAPEVAALASRAKELGIDIPADRLVNSKPLDAVASGLNYVPFSGRAATEAKLNSQLNRAVSRLIGQNDSNMTLSLRKAGTELGGKFDTALQATMVKFDEQLLEDVARVFNTAEKELGADALKPIASQVDELVKKGANGAIDGQAAYNIKRTLDRIGRGNTPTAYHALELKGVLMDALNRSMGPEGAKMFAKTREQYSNMLALEKLAKNGVEGELSVARLANMQNINNKPLQEIADIAAQFVKPRESQHGAMQRAIVGLGSGSVAAATGGAPALLGALGISALGRGTNKLLDSNLGRSLLLEEPLQIGLNPSLYRMAPVIGAQ
jgi:hypothetical protein